MLHLVVFTKKNQLKIIFIYSSLLIVHFSFRKSSKIVELEEELRVVGNNLKSLEVSEEKVCVFISNISYQIIVKEKKLKFLLSILLKSSLFELSEKTKIQLAIGQPT